MNWYFFSFFLLFCLSLCPCRCRVMLPSRTMAMLLPLLCSTLRCPVLHCTALWALMFRNPRVDPPPRPWYHFSLSKVLHVKLGGSEASGWGRGGLVRCGAVRYFCLGSARDICMCY
ncbi:hypothetical protein BS50DRAFT_92888 [Corynespora cassiicola Philippines]|uniref:Secreted protein n=1 Tax=Corynespora cassiicola Philippines TaxID=1448308 RepID=A0A2T2NEQ5_CORCC|nr:hypothetical protein BS50DRAFT_92888 [Corynespora cassiicola Philippines]